jgi:hypothetical protein
MNKKRASASRSKLLSSVSIFGPPPLLEGEDAAIYEEQLARFSNAVRPTDFLEEIWVRDAVDVTWNIFRLRRILAAYLSAQVWHDVNDKASSLAEAEAEPLEGTEKEEMGKLLDPNSELSWETLMAQNPRANEKFQEFWAAAKATLDINEIQAKVMLRNLDTIERIEHLITIEEQRLDSVIREMDRHRGIRKHLDSKVKDVEEAEFKIVKPKTTIRKITNKKAA